MAQHFHAGLFTVHRHAADDILTFHLLRCDALARTGTLGPARALAVGQDSQRHSAVIIERCRVVRAAFQRHVVGFDHQFVQQQADGVQPGSAIIHLYHVLRHIVRVFCLVRVKHIDDDHRRHICDFKRCRERATNRVRLEIGAVADCILCFRHRVE